MLFPDIAGRSRAFTPLIPVRTLPTGESHAQRHRKALFPRWSIQVDWDLLTLANAKLIQDHVTAVRGGATEFDWFDWRVWHWTSVLIGYGTGATATFDLPGKSVSDAQFFRGTGSVTGVITEGVGPDGRARVVINETPPAGQAVWMHGRMKRLFTVTFERDPQPAERDLETGYYLFSTRFMTAK